MSPLSPDVLPLAEVVALANPPETFRSWVPVRQEKWSEFSIMQCLAPDGPPDAGETSFVVDAEHQVLGSGAAVCIRYERNLDLAECPENIALDDDGGLEDDVIQRILDRVQPKQGFRTVIDFRTLSVDSFSAEASDGPFYPEARVLSPHVHFPSVLLSSLRAMHRLPQARHILLVKTKLDDLSNSVRVLKLCNPFGGSHLLKEAEFMTNLPETNFLVRPTHMVLDEAGLFHGLLSDYHPASSLNITMSLLHPDTVPPVLPPSGDDRSSGSLAGIPASISWPVKLAWATDIAAAVAWLHAQAIVWADLKTDNILLCTDGHCRLIDCCPGGGWTAQWCPPEAQSLGWEGTAEGDVFALGLVLWCVAVEVAAGQREQDFVSPRLLWTDGMPQWFQTLVSSCLDPEPGRRPSAYYVHETLVLSGESNV
ncbi:kinase-like domain-containing protein [Mycena metata]|uniref:Kinase-like domain-containing protein n=1 Tax=Mycena metata TaxID=1033252 RepID=A0AAD7JU70_9AGAR|nr:kinase-like domain-containing protein [Mycena metata]